MSNDLIQDIEESLKKERHEELWKEYGPWLITGIVLAVLITALIVGLRSWNENVNTRNTTILLQALDSEDMPAALGAHLDDLRPGQQALGRLTAAGLLLREGDRDGALAHYRAAAADRSIPSEWRDLATLMAVRTGWQPAGTEQLEEAVAPAPDTQALLAQLRPVWESRNSPWRWHARIQAALITAHDLQDYETAQAHLREVLTARDLPPSLTERARSLHHVYATLAMENAAAAVPDGAAETITEDAEG